MIFISKVRVRVSNVVALRSVLAVMYPKACAPRARVASVYARNAATSVGFGMGVPCSTTMEFPMVVQ